ncbi:hypothetical protein HYC85_021660 [Camellia sinensis]|uniref:Uncharacterized protein n=1 Tax=Camellia sinensis TaxID=4442 RepID=A0A7J7GI91_CAMSI|nr:hypothetical protein HYC85_021660 [Camellia sinensis]
MADPILPQFPQPTRPMFSYDVNSPNPSSSEHETNIVSLNPSSSEHEINIERNSDTTIQELTDEFHYPDVLELPTDKNHTVQFSESVQYNHDRSFEPATSSSEDRIHFSPSTGKTPKGEKEAVDELLLILIECMDELNTRSRESLLRKFFSEIEKEERLERFIVERLKQSKVKSITDLCEKLPASVREEMNSDGSNNVLPRISETEDYVDDGITRTRSIHDSVEELSLKLERFKVRTLKIGGDMKGTTRRQN